MICQFTFVLGLQSTTQIFVGFVLAPLFINVPVSVGIRQECCTSPFKRTSETPERAVRFTEVQFFAFDSSSASFLGIFAPASQWSINL